MPERKAPSWDEIAQVIGGRLFVRGDDVLKKPCWIAWAHVGEVYEGASIEGSPYVHVTASRSGYTINCDLSTLLEAIRKARGDDA